MSPLIVFGIFASLLFGGAFLTRRRFGMLGLALAGGSVLAGVWGDVVGLLFAAEGIRLATLSPENLALIVVTILPASVLFVRGPRSDSSWQRLGSALLFTLLALALVIQPLQPLLAPSGGTGMAIYRYIMQYRELIVLVGMTLAFADAFFMKGSSHAKPGSKH